MYFSIPILLCLFCVASPRLYSESVFLHQFRRSYGWQFIDRMTLEPGVSSATLTVTFMAKDYLNSYTLQFVAVPSLQYKTEVASKCVHSNPLSVAISLPKYQHTITATIEFNVSVSTTYHFILRDCQKVLVNDPLDPAAYLDIQLSISNNSRSYSWLEMWTMVVSVVLVGVNYVLLVRLRGIRSDEEQYHVLMMVVGEYVCVIGLCFKVVSHVLYIFVTQREYGALEFFYICMHTVADSMVSTVLILLSYGWMVSFKRSQQFDLYLPLLGMLGIVNVLMALISKVTDGGHDKYHMHDSIPTYIMFGFKCIALLLLVLGVVYSVCFESNGEKKRKMHVFFNRLVPVAVLYVASMPICTYLVEYCEPGERKDIVFLMVEGIKAVINSIIVYWFTSKHSVFSLLAGESFMQKGNKYY